MRFFRSLKQLLSHPMLWAGLGSIFLALIAGTRLTVSPQSSTQWSDIKDWGMTDAYRSPALLLTSDQHALIWQPLLAEAPLTFSSLDHSGDQPILPYPDLKPSRWQAAPAAVDTYHLVWTEPDGRLYSALIHVSGETMRGPIELAPGVRTDFITLPSPDGRLLVLWADMHTGQLYATDIDQAGRPQPRSSVAAQAGPIAATMDQAGIPHITWLTALPSNGWTVHYQTGPLDKTTASTLYTIPLSSKESITSFAIGLDLTHCYLFWGLTTAEQPDVEQVYVLTFPLDQSDTIALAELQLPQRNTPSAAVSLPPYGHMTRLADTPNHPARLRWPRTAPGQQSVLPLAITLRTSEGWRPAVVYYQAGAALGFQIVAPLPADAGPPALAVDPSGRLTLAWLGLNGTRITLYTAMISP